MKPETASRFARIAIGAVIGCFVLSAIGCPVGCMVGFRVAYPEPEAGFEVLYSQSPPVSKSTTFWVVHYDDQDQPTLQQSEGTIWDLGPEQHFQPSVESQASVGPWSGPGPPTYKNSTIPSGHHTYQTGTVRFTTQSDGITTAELNIFPLEHQDGWVRETYTYEITEDAARLVTSARKGVSNANDWATEIITVYAALITAGSAAFGLVLGTAVGATVGKRHRAAV